MSKKESKGEWFAECGNNDSNNRLAEALAAKGYGYDSEAKSEEVLCHDGKQRPLFRVPGPFVRQMMRAKKGSNVLVFRFWKRNHHDVPAYPMDFIETQGSVKRSVAYKSAAARLKAIKAAGADKA